jgi:NADPH-dependent curcumin reductase CurA
MAILNRMIVLAARPEGAPQESDFKLVERPLPPLHAGTFLARTEFFSVDPYMRIRISDESYAEPTNIGDVMLGGAVGTVVESSRASGAGRSTPSPTARACDAWTPPSRRSPPRSACWACRA